MIVTFSTTIKIDDLGFSSHDVRLTKAVELNSRPQKDDYYHDDDLWEAEVFSVSCNIKTKQYEAFVEGVCYKNVYYQKKERYCENIDEAIEQYWQNGWIRKQT